MNLMLNQYHIILKTSKETQNPTLDSTWRWSVQVCMFYIVCMHYISWDVLRYLGESVSSDCIISCKCCGVNLRDIWNCIVPNIGVKEKDSHSWYANAFQHQSRTTRSLQETNLDAQITAACSGRTSVPKESFVSRLISMVQYYSDSYSIEDQVAKPLHFSNCAKARLFSTVDQHSSENHQLSHMMCEAKPPMAKVGALTSRIHANHARIRVCVLRHEGTSATPYDWQPSQACKASGLVAGFGQESSLPTLNPKRGNGTSIPRLTSAPADRLSNPCKCWSHAVNSCQLNHCFSKS